MPSLAACSCCLVGRPASSLTMEYAMIKSELVLRLRARLPHLYQRDIERVIDAILEQITRGLAQGDRVELRGFGAFFTKRHKARNGRNPRTGAAVLVSAKARPFFRTGKELRQRLNQSENDLPKVEAKSSAGGEV